MFSAFGSGESTFNICSSSNWKDYLEFCFRKTGKVTEILWQLDEGDTIGFRGPYGNGYPMETWEGRDLIFIAGGIGKCGRCNCGPVYVCKEGLVFSLEQIRQLPNDY